MRSLLFVPGDRADMIAKVPRWKPDAVVVDLEDAVAGADKDSARSVAVAAIARVSHPLVFLRVNAAGTPWHLADLAAAARAGVAGIALPKVERPEDLDAAQRSGLSIIGGLETARGVANARAMCEQPNVVAVYFGAEDFIADMGGRRTRGGLEVVFARSEVCLAARLAGVPAIDQAVVSVHDEAAFTADAEQGRALGYQGKITLHPVQVTLAHRVFTPSEQEVTHARAVLAQKTGVGVVDGQMVDDVHRKMAGQTLARWQQGDQR
ncbi:CoA ester lyase [Leekyejoonella antrihumi]|uniref:CoA ester lyase n=2 Tax=Leekyejoonella antrihumi TaxID=1660198 RepID=A0A563DWA8_9MICO|nr:CoA ester lyase [Leekyejoonella antrihumi]